MTTLSPPDEPIFGDNATFFEELEGDAYYVWEEMVWLMGRVGTAIVLLLLLGGCGFLCWYRRRMSDLRDGAGSSFQPYRCWHGVKSDCFNCCCCSYCCPNQQLASDYMRPSVPHTLQITLLKVKNLSRRCTFYLEAFAAPIEGRPKTSRVHHKVVGGCDLGGEVLEIDWYGDEEGLVIHAVEYKGREVSADEAIGELKLSRQVVEKYAREAAQSGASTGGSRLFALKPLGAESSRVRKRRFKGPSAIVPFLQPIVPGIVKSLQEQLGGQGEELQGLQDELRSLRAENERLGGGRSTGQIDTSDSTQELVMSVAARLELKKPRHCPNSPEVFRSPSFEEHLEVGDMQTFRFTR